MTANVKTFCIIKAATLIFSHCYRQTARLLLRSWPATTTTTTVSLDINSNLGTVCDMIMIATAVIHMGCYENLAKVAQLSAVGRTVFQLGSRCQTGWLAHAAYD